MLSAAVQHFVLFVLIGSSALLLVSSTTTLRGVAPELTSSWTDFKCDGNALPLHKVNDNYCDCTDGSDEPGTSACSFVDQENKAFYCPNTGHLPTQIFRSQVDDGICDCCDGSDEMVGVCQNSCATVAAKHASETKEREERRQQGLKAKEELLVESKRIRDEKTQELENLRARVNEIDIDLQHLEEIKKDEEALEVTEREAIRQASLAKKVEWEKEQAEKEATAAATKEAPPPPPVEEALKPTALECVSWRQTKDCRGDGEREESQDRPCTESIGNGASGFCECQPDPTEPDRPAMFPFHCDHISFTCLEVCRDQGLPPATNSEQPAQKEEFKVDEGKDYEREGAKDARSKYSALSNEKIDIERKIGDIDSFLKAAYGPSDAFLALRDKCYEKHSGEYKYTLCLFKGVTQAKTSGYGSSNLGNWKSFKEQTYASWGGGYDFSIMIFDSGDHCYSGPIRSTTVHVICGPDSAVTDIQEPSMCTYSMTFQTPAACE